MGAISLGAVKALAARKRSDFRPWKKKTADELLIIRNRLPMRPPIWQKLRLHQKVCVLIGAYRKQFGFFLDTGMGKTLTILAIYSYWEAMLASRDPKQRRRWLILVPNKTNKAEWGREVKKHTPHFAITKLEGSSAAKWEQIVGDDFDLLVETYGGFMQLVSELVKDERRGKKKKDKQRLKWSERRIVQLCKLIDGIVLDESIKVMNRSALPSRIVYQLRKRCDFLYELNGTPFGRDPEMIWGQVFLIDLGHSLGETLGLFRAAFFKEIDAYWKVTYRFIKAKQQILNDWLADRTIEYQADEGDLPKVVPIKKVIELPHDAEAYAMEAKRQIVKTKGNYIESKNAYNRIRQISSGWLGYKDDDTGERASVNFTPNVKLDYLMDYIDTIDERYQIIVFHEYNHSGKLIMDAMQAAKISAAWIYGKTKDPDAELKRYVDGAARVLVLSNSAGSYGLNLQMTKYGIYFEAPASPIIRYQTRKRFERQYSPHKSVFRVDLVVEGTYDQKILDWHEEGKDLFDGIIRGKFKSRQDGEIV